MRVLTFLVMLVLAGCSTTQRVQAETAVADVLVSDADERALGEQVHQELERQGVRYLSDPVVVSYVDGVLNRVGSQAKKDRDTHWHLHVIDDKKTVNAFATPGGHVYVYTGLLTDAQNEAEVASVLSHELGHVVARHAARQMVQIYGLETVAQLALGQNPSALAKIGAQLVGTGALLAHSRADENEADEYGVKYTRQAGYDPRALTTFFKRLQAQEGHVPRPLVWLSTHPATADRISHVEWLIDGASGELGTERLAPVKARLVPSASLPGGFFSVSSDGS